MLRSLDLLHSAAKGIETDGYEAFHTTVKQVGVEMASALLVAHLRRQILAMPTYQGAPQVGEWANRVIQQEFPAFFRLASQPIASFFMGEWYCFDNFSAFAVMSHDRLVPTVEHGYQASKFTDEKLIEEVLNAPSAHEAKKIGNRAEYKTEIRTDWEEVKAYGVMKPLLRDKRDRHEYVQKKLIQSRGMILVEDSPVDSFWGRGPDFNGLDMLGKLWMELRDELD